MWSIQSKTQYLRLVWEVLREQFKSAPGSAAHAIVSDRENNHRVTYVSRPYIYLKDDTIYHVNPIN